MIRLISQPHRFLFSVLCLVVFTGCIGSKRVSTVVYEDKTRTVKLEARLGKDKKPIEYGYHHPVDLTPKDFEKLLSSIYIKRSKTLLGLLIPMLGAKDREQAFSADEIQFLSQSFSVALAKATPDQRVTFLLFRPRGAQIREVTSGAVFVREDLLNLVLANERYVVDREKMSGADEDDPLYVYEPDAFKILPGKHQELVKEDRKIRDLEGDLPKTWVAIDYQKILSAQPVVEPQAAPETPEPSLQTSPQVPSGEPVPVSPFEDKLRVLKRLREQGLITEEEYQAKKQELLKSF
jgi:hypothetical protein